MTTDSIISKVWSFCTTLRDDGVGYGDYLGQLTYLIFLKMADEYGRPPYKKSSTTTTTPSSASRSERMTCVTSSIATTRRIATSARKYGMQRRIPKAFGGNARMMNSPPGTKPAPIFSGSKTTPSLISTIFLTRPISPTKSMKTSRRDC